MRGAPWLWPLIGVLVAPAAYADLAARSRNSVVFVESTRQGEEWEAFRLVDPRAPATYHVSRPGRILLRVRTLPRAEPVDAVAAVLVDGQVTLTLRVPATLDAEARLTDGGGQPSLAKLYLLEVEEEHTTVTVRHSEGPALLVAARFAPPLEASGASGESGVPLVAPRTSAAASVPRVGVLERGGGALATGPEAPDPEARPIEPPLPDGDAAHGSTVSADLRTVEAAPAPRAKAQPARERHPAFDERLDLPTQPTGRGAALLVELRGGAWVDRLLTAPGVAAGVDFRGALFPRSRPRAIDLGVSVDIGYGREDEVVRLAGAPVDVAALEHLFGALSADLRFELFVRPGVVSVYGSGGGGVLLGRATVKTSRGTVSAGSSGFLGALRLGATLGSEGNRPFLELRALLGQVQSEALRPGPADAPGDPVGWYAFGATLGWRFELGYAPRTPEAGAQ